MDGHSFNNALAKAQRLILDEDWQAQVTFAENQQSKKMNGNNDSSDLAAMEAQLFGTSSTSPTKSMINSLPQESYTPQRRKQQNYGQIQMLQEQPRTRDVSKTKLPKAIMESYQQMPSPLVEDNGLDAILTTNAQQLPQQRQMVQETYNPQPVSGGIDYQYIEYLIEKAVKKAVGQGVLNESTGMAGMAGMRICDGNKIQFLDKKGNLYEGILTLKKRAK